MANFHLIAFLFLYNSLPSTLWKLNSVFNLFCENLYPSSRDISLLPSEEILTWESSPFCKSYTLLIPPNWIPEYRIVILQGASAKDYSLDEVLHTQGPKAWSAEECSLLWGKDMLFLSSWKRFVVLLFFSYFTHTHTHTHVCAHTHFPYECNMFFHKWNVLFLQ